MFIEFDLRPFSAVLSDLFIFVDIFLVLANKTALNRLILRHCYFRVAYLCLLAGTCLCVLLCVCVCAYVGVWLVFFGDRKKEK